MPGHRPQSLGHGAQDLVAHAVSERVVDNLEVVEVEEHHRESVAIALQGWADRAVQDIFDLLQIRRKFRATSFIRRLEVWIMIRQEGLDQAACFFQDRRDGRHVRAFAAVYGLEDSDAPLAQGAH